MASLGHNELIDRRSIDALWPRDAICIGDIGGQWFGQCFSYVTLTDADYLTISCLGRNFSEIFYQDAMILFNKIFENPAGKMFSILCRPQSVMAIFTVRDLSGNHHVSILQILQIEEWIHYVAGSLSQHFPKWTLHMVQRITVKSLI